MEIKAGSQDSGRVATPYFDGKGEGGSPADLSSDRLLEKGRGSAAGNGSPHLYQSLLEDEDFESYQQRRSAKKFQYIVGVSLFVLVFGAIVAVIYVFAFPKNKSGNDSGGDVGSCQGSCYIEPSCTATSIYYDPTTGFSNDTGWSNIDSGACCQMCFPGTKNVVCFNSSDVNCQSKTGAQDYDYLLFDQIWLPQLCTAWEMGHDPTVSHLAGSKCRTPYQSQGTLSIHGLWPNYYNGYPQCCGQNGSTPQALDPAAVRTWAIYPELSQKWVDPLGSVGNQAVDSGCCDTCYILNHEWEKHGGCYSSDPEVYFSAGLAINRLIADKTNTINAMRGQVVSTASIKRLFSKSVNVICDPKDPYQGGSNTGVFMELQSCWIKSGFGFEQVNCANATSLAFTAPCPEFAYVRGEI